MMSTLLLQLTLTDLTGEDAGEYSCLLLTVEGGQVDKGTGSVTLQVIALMLMMLIVMFLMLLMMVLMMLMMRVGKLTRGLDQSLCR